MYYYKTSRSNFIKLFILAAITLVLPIATFADSKVGDRPNIIFMIADDLGYGDIGCYGQGKIKTPNIDKMASEGIRFTQCYASSPVCAPTRCSLLTGLHTGHARLRGNGVKAHKYDMEAIKGHLMLSKNEFTVAKMLKEAGYTTGGFGKWGIGNLGTIGTPDMHGFDTFYGYINKRHNWDYYTGHLYRNTTLEELPGNKGGKRGQYGPDVITGEILKFIRNNKDRPFFCYIPWTIPHGIHDVPDLGRYKGETWGKLQKTYAAMITRMDGYVGKIFNLLKDLDIDHKTIVFFTSDNGPNRQFLSTFNSNGPFRGVKAQLYEGGICMPMIVRWPGKIPAGRVSDFVWSFTDFMPTAAGVAGIQAPDGLDGMSVLPTLLGKEQQPHEYLYWEFYNPFHQAVRMGNWKGIRYGTKEPVVLYNLTNDMEERHDVAGKHPGIINKIKNIMDTSHTDSAYWPIREYRQKRKKIKWYHYYLKRLGRKIFGSL